MGEVNNVLCDYLGMAVHYADFWNGTVFRGKRRIKNWQLERHDREYYKPKNKKVRPGMSEGTYKCIVKARKMYY